MPRIIGHAVKVPALITVIAIVIGGALLGIVGALVATPMPPRCSYSPEKFSIPVSTRSDNTIPGACRLARPSGIRDHESAC